MIVSSIAAAAGFCDLSANGGGQSELGLEAALRQAICAGRPTPQLVGKIEGTRKGSHGVPSIVSPADAYSRTHGIRRLGGRKVFGMPHLASHGGREADR
jgi:hypothetical protein